MCQERQVRQRAIKLHVPVTGQTGDYNFDDLLREKDGRDTEVSARETPQVLYQIRMINSLVTTEGIVRS